MALKGDLSAVGLSDVFQMLAMSQKEGTLVVQDATITKRIFFSPQGITLLSRGTRSRFRIGEILVQMGSLTEEQLNEALKEQKATGKRFGDLLMQKGWVTQEDIDRVVRRQIEDEIFDLFLWRDAQFEFEEGPMPDRVETVMQAVMHLKFDVNALLLEALRRVDEWGRINEKIEGVHCVFVFPDDATREAALGEMAEGDREVGQLFDGTRSLADIRRETGRGSFDVCKPALDLLDAGRLVQVPADQILALARDQEKAGAEQAAARLYRSAIDSPSEEGVDADIVRRCADLCHKTGDSEEAQSLYVRLAKLYRDEGETEPLADVLAAMVAMNPDNTEVGLELLDLYADAKNSAKAEALGEQLLTLAEARNDPETGRDVATKLAAMDPRNLGRRMRLVRILSTMQDADSEMREELRFLTRSLTPGNQQHDAILRELRGLAGEFFREEYVAPTPPVKKAKKVLRKLAFTVAIIIVVIGGGVGVVLFDPFGSQGSGNGASNGNGTMPVLLDQAKFDGLLEKFDAALREENLAQAAALLAGARKLAKEAQDEFALGECDAKEKDLNNERRAVELLSEASSFKGDGKIREAAARVREVIEKYGSTNARRGALVPVRVSVVPAGAQVVLEGGETKSTPVVLDLDHLTPRLLFRLAGFQDHVENLTSEMIFSGRITVRMGARKATWTSHPGSTIEAELVYTPGAVHVPTAQHIYSYVERDGGSQPRVEIRRSLLWGPIAVGRSLVFANRRNEIHAVDVSDPMSRSFLAWSPATMDEEIVAPLLADGANVIVTLKTEIVSVNLSSGVVTPIVVDEGAAPIVGSPVVTDKTIAVVRGDGKLYGYDRAGARLWSPIDLGVALPAHVIRIGEDAVVVTDAGKISGYGLSTGRLSWDGPAVGEIVAPPVVVDLTVYLAMRDQSVVVIDWGGSGPRQRIAIGSDIAGAPAVSRDRIYVGGKDGTLRVIDRNQPGRPLWTFDAGEPIRRTPLVKGAFVYIAAGKSVYALAKE